MQTNMHHPRFVSARTHDAGSATEFHTITVRDNSSRGGEAVVFIAPDWSDWDALVEAVEEYRDRITRHPEVLAG